MFAMFTAFFSMLARLFNAGNKAAGALENLAGWAEDSTGSFADKAKKDREATMAALDHQVKSVLNNPQAYIDAQAKAEAKTES